MIRLISGIISFFLPRLFGGGRRELSLRDALRILKAGVRGLMRDMSLGFVGIALATAGFLVAYFDVLTQIDLARGLVFGAVATGGGVLVLIGAALVSLAWRRKKSDAFAEAFVGEAEQRHVSPLEQALSALVLDIVREREFDREARGTHSAGNGKDTESSYVARAPEEKWEGAQP